MVGKPNLEITLLIGAALIGVLSGQCLIYSAGADPPPAALVQQNPSLSSDSNDLSSALNKPNGPQLRFKKEDFVPIPEMAPIPLDDPKMERKPPLKVNIPNIQEAKQPSQVRDTLQAAPAQPAAKNKGFFGRLMSNFDSDEHEDKTADAASQRRKPMGNTESSAIQQLFGSNDAATQPVVPTQMQKRGTMKRNNFTETPQPNATAQAVPVAAVAAQDLPPPKPLSEPVKQAIVHSTTVAPSAPPATNAQTDGQTASLSQQPAPLPVYQSPQVIIKKEVIHLTPPGSTVATNSIVPPVPLNNPQRLGQLSPAAGAEPPPASGPLITLSDIPPEPPKEVKKPVAALPPPVIPPSDLNNGLPLIALPGSDATTPANVASKTTPAAAPPATPVAKAPPPQPLPAPSLPAIAAQIPPPAAIATPPASVAQETPPAPAKVAEAPTAPAKTQVAEEKTKEEVQIKPSQKTADIKPDASPPPSVAPTPANDVAQSKPAAPKTSVAAVNKPVPPPKALSSPLWNEPSNTASATVPAVTTASSQQPPPLPWMTQAAPPVQAAIPPVNNTPPLPPADPSTYGGSARPPQPSIASNPIGPARLPANVPSYAVQHWQGPDAVEANAAHTLPPAVVAPPPSAVAANPAPPWDETPYDNPYNEAQQAQVEAPPAQQAPAQAAPEPSPFAPPQQQAKAYDAQPLEQPAPVQVQLPVQQAPAPTPKAPMPAAPVQTADATEPKPTLSEESKKIVQNLHNQPKTANRAPAKPVFIEHSRDLSALDMQPKPQGQEGQVGHEAMGVKIEIKPPRINFDYELEKAYNALIAGQSNVAVEIYKRVLENDANNKNALFGLATTYHRAGQIDQARPIYSRLLTVDPGNSDGLNNFLVLLSDEAPEEALLELVKLSERNPQYSALPAQIAVIYQKMGMYEKAGQYMFQAIEMAPENITYKYNFAIMLDKQQRYDEAAKLYRQIIQAHQRGETIPGNIQKIQQRLTFISSNRPS